jgi:hypothetical protein
VDILIGTYEDGRFSIRESPETLLISAHVLFDRSIDEWIDVTADFPRKSMTRSVSEDPAVIAIQSASSVLRLKADASGKHSIYVEGRNSIGPVSLECPLGPLNVRSTTRSAKSFPQRSSASYSDPSIYPLGRR